MFLDSRLHILIEDLDAVRYQVPEPIFKRPYQESWVAHHDNPFTFTLETDPIWLRVQRKHTNQTIFDTTNTTLIYERQFLRLKTWLPADANIYGLGEHADSFRLPTKNYTRTLWSRDSPAIPEGENLYGNHPVYFDHRADSTTGFLMMNSNGMEVVLDQDSQGRRFLEWRMTGGVIDMYIFGGPTPVEVAQQYAALIGKPAMVPYWSLGVRTVIHTKRID